MSAIVHHPVICFRLCTHRGVPKMHLDDLVGLEARHGLPLGTPLSWDLKFLCL